MPDAQAGVQIVISGTAVGLEEALAGAQQALGRFGAVADHASEQAGEHLARGEHKAGEEAALLGERARTAAEMVALLGAESSEQILKIEGLNHAFSEAQHAFGGFGGAIAATAGSFALFKGLDFLKESAQEALNSEEAWNQLSRAYRGNAEGLEHTKEVMEDTRATWEALGFTQGQVAAMAARAKGMGLDPTKILADPAALADVAEVLGVDIPRALDTISKPRGATQVLQRLGLSVAQITAATRQMRNLDAAQRAAFIMHLVEGSRFGGQAAAGFNTAKGQFQAFSAAMADLREEVGTALLPALTQLATSLTGLLQAAETAAKPFGGLANVIKTLFIPMVGAGLFLFTGLRGVMTRMVDLLLGRLVGAFAQTAESVAEADTQAKDLADDLNAIPELVTTTAVFVPATAIKDAYKANIYSIPREWTTTAIFEPAAVSTAAGQTVAIGTAIAAPAAAEAAAAVEEAQAIVSAEPVRIPTVLAAPAAVEISREALRINALMANALHAPVHLGVPSAAERSREARTINALMGHALSVKPTVTIGVVDHVNNRIGGIISAARAKLASAHLFANVGTTVAFAGGMAIADAIFNGAKFNQPDFSKLPPKVTWSASDQAQLEALNKRLAGPLHVHVDGGTVQANLGSIGGALVVNASLTGDDRTVLRQQIQALQDQKKAAEAYARALEDARKHPLPVQVHFDVGELLKLVGTVALGTMIANALGPLLDPKKILGLVGAGAQGLFGFLTGKGLGGTAAAAASESAEARAINDLMGGAQGNAWWQNLLRRATGGTTTGRGPKPPTWTDQEWQNYLKGSKPPTGALSGIAADIAEGVEGAMPAAMEGVAGGIEAGVGLQVGGALVGGLAEIAPMVVTGAADIGALILSGVAEGATAGLATPLVAALLGGLGLVTVGVFTHGFGLLGKDGKKEADKLKGAFNLGRVFDDLKGAAGSAFKKVGDTVGGIGGTIIKGIASGVSAAWKTITGIGATIIGGILSAVNSGVISLENAWITMFDAIIKMVNGVLKHIPVPFGKSPQIPLIPPIRTPRSGGSSSSASLPIQAGHQALFMDFPPAPAATPHAASASPTTLNVTFHINGAQSPELIAREIERALMDFVRGVRSQRRLHG